MKDLANQIAELMTSNGKTAPEMTHALKELGEGDMQTLLYILQMLKLYCICIRFTQKWQHVRITHFSASIRCKTLKASSGSRIKNVCSY